MLAQKKIFYFVKATFNALHYIYASIAPNVFNTHLILMTSSSLAGSASQRKCFCQKCEHIIFPQNTLFRAKYCRTLIRLLYDIKFVFEAEMITFVWFTQCFEHYSRNSHSF